MLLKINKELLSIFQEIINQKLSINKWAEKESSDEFQTENYCGGFDATENEFCFSYYDENKIEYWFQVSLEEIDVISKGKFLELPLRIADRKR